MRNILISGKFRRGGGRWLGVGESIIGLCRTDYMYVLLQSLRDVNRHSQKTSTLVRPLWSGLTPVRLRQLSEKDRNLVPPDWEQTGEWVDGRIRDLSVGCSHQLSRSALWLYGVDSPDGSV
jgi:hypothetical protein